MKKEKEACSKFALKNIDIRLNFLKISKEKVLLDIKIIREGIKNQLELKETTNEYINKMNNFLHAIKALKEINEEERILNHIKKDYEMK